MVFIRSGAHRILSIKASRALVPVDTASSVTDCSFRRCALYADEESHAFAHPVLAEAKRGRVENVATTQSGSVTLQSNSSKALASTHQPSAIISCSPPRSALYSPLATALPQPQTMLNRVCSCSTASAPSAASVELRSTTPATEGILSR